MGPLQRFKVFSKPRSESEPVTGDQPAIAETPAVQTSTVPPMSDQMNDLLRRETLVHHHEVSSAFWNNFEGMSTRRGSN